MNGFRFRGAGKSSILPIDRWIRGQDSDHVTRKRSAAKRRKTLVGRVWVRVMPSNWDWGGGDLKKRMTVGPNHKKRQMKANRIKQRVMVTSLVFELVVGGDDPGDAARDARDEAVVAAIELDVATRSDEEISSELLHSFISLVISLSSELERRAGARVAERERDRETIESERQRERRRRDERDGDERDGDDERERDREANERPRRIRTSEKRGRPTERPRARERDREANERPRRIRTTSEREGDQRRDHDSGDNGTERPRFPRLRDDNKNRTREPRDDNNNTRSKAKQSTRSETEHAIGVTKLSFQQEKQISNDWKDSLVTSVTENCPRAQNRNRISKSINQRQRGEKRLREIERERESIYTTAGGWRTNERTGGGCVGGSTDCLMRQTTIAHWTTGRLDADSRRPDRRIPGIGMVGVEGRLTPPRAAQEGSVCLYTGSEAQGIEGLPRPPAQRSRPSPRPPSTYRRLLFPPASKTTPRPQPLLLLRHVTMVSINVKLMRQYSNFADGRLLIAPDKRRSSIQPTLRSPSTSWTRSRRMQASQSPRLISQGSAATTHKLANLCRLFFNEAGGCIGHPGGAWGVRASERGGCPGGQEGGANERAGRTSGRGERAGVEGVWVGGAGERAGRTGVRGERTRQMGQTSGANERAGLAGPTSSVESAHDPLSHSRVGLADAFERSDVRLVPNLNGLRNLNGEGVLVGRRRQRRAGIGRNGVLQNKIHPILNVAPIHDGVKDGLWICEDGSLIWEG
ncbi:hypothetical protein B0H12DRAFT_1077800 [Mycena haematopus]|nr:hypothetical protein B0H12DRAFT_1077800 [Mycena haematopus]